MFKSDWLFGCCTTVTVTVEVKECRIKWLQMNVERSERNLYRSQHRYTELLIFVVFSFVPLLTTNIQTISNFSLRPLTQNCKFSCYFPPYNDRNPCISRLQYPIVASINVEFNIYRCTGVTCSMLQKPYLFILEVWSHFNTKLCGANRVYEVFWNFKG